MAGGFIDRMQLKNQVENMVKRPFNRYVVITVLFLLCSVPFTVAVEDTVYDTIMQRIRANEWEDAADVSKLNTNVADALSTISSDGSWPDINYASTVLTNWPGTIHLDRVKNFALAYTLESSAYFQNSSLYQKLVDALTFFYNRNPISNNWYVQQIGAPNRLGQVLILMRSGVQQVPVGLETQILTRIKDTGGNPLNYTGSNKVAVAMHWVYRGLLTKNQSVLSHGVEQVYYPVFMTTNEGLQHDYSFFQHGQQLYTGGYALAFVRNTIELAGVTVGTEYAISDEKLAMIVPFFRDHVLTILRGSTFLYNTVGRGVAISGGVGGSFIAPVAARFKQVDPENHALYDAAIERLKGNKPGTYQVPRMHYHYWRGDYTLLTSPDYTFDVRMASTRTARSENGNGENLKGYFLTEGANAIVIEGNEYRNIFPVWDWARIPGTTLPQKTTIPRPTQWEKPGNSTFAGGVSNGNYGVTTYSMNNPDFNVNTQAKKSWFMFGEEIVCLGAGIQSTASEEINTTVNQCMQNGTAVVKHNASERYIQLGSVTNFSDQLDWIHHNKIAYFFPGGGNLNLSFGPQSGSWQSITNTQSSTMLTSNVFKLWFNHGIKPGQARYEYIIVPNKTLAQTRAYNPSDIVVAANGEGLQAVYNKKLNLWGLVFHKALTYTNAEFSVTVDAPCALMLEVTESHYKGWISDPSQTASTIEVQFESTVSGYAETVLTTMPTSPYAGSTVEFIVTMPTSNREMNETSTSITLAANPVNSGDTVFLNVFSTTDTPVNITLLDVSGKVMLTKNYQPMVGLNQLSIETGVLTSGVYVLNTTQKNRKVSVNRLLVN